MGVAHACFKGSLGQSRGRPRSRRAPHPSGARLQFDVRSRGERETRFTKRNNTIDGKQLPPPDPKFGGVIEDEASKSKPWWPPRVTRAEGRAKRPPHHNGRCRLRRAEHIWRRDTHTHHGQDCQGGIALQSHVFNRALLADPGGSHYRPQSPLCRFGVISEQATRLTGFHTASSKKIRQPSAAYCSTTATAQPGSGRPQHAGFRCEPSRPLRSMADRHGV